MDVNQLTSLFVSEEERLVSVLGNSTVQTFLASGILGNGFAVLSNQRVYFRGRCLVRTGRRFHTQQEERTVDVRDVTGTGFIHKDPFWMLILAGLLFGFGLVGFIDALIKSASYGFDNESIEATLICILPGLLFWWLYRRNKRTLFEISYAGGGIAFNVAWFPVEEAQLFQKNLKLMSDAVKKQEKQVKPDFSAAGELEKLAGLLEKGLISQEEFDTQKHRLISSR